jgi:hypothetical protein
LLGEGFERLSLARLFGGSSGDPLQPTSDKQLRINAHSKIRFRTIV